MEYQPKHFELPECGVWPGDGITQPYVLNDDITVAVDVALATQRPLLIAGPPGSGKSTLAATMAALLGGWRYLRHTLTSRSRLEDLTGQVDQLERLHDAHLPGALKPDWAYLKPGLLWWAFSPRSAKRRGAAAEQLQKVDPRVAKSKLSTETVANTDAVILLDEIDKAEPDLPNDLLEALDLRRFQVPHGPVVEAPKHMKLLVMITTNGERDLPPAFLRRCVALRLDHPDPAALQLIGHFHFRDAPEELVVALAEKVVSLREEAIARDRRPPSTSEYLDALGACMNLGITPAHPRWRHIEDTALIKDIEPNEESARFTG